MHHRHLTDADLDTLDAAALARLSLYRTERGAYVELPADEIARRLAFASTAQIERRYQIRRDAGADPDARRDDGGA